ncbi:MAG: hypothetical protein V3571_10210, partial [Pseudodesulfovibrio sp.]
MKSAVLVLALLLSAPSALAAGPVFGHGPLLAGAGPGTGAEDGRRSRPGTVVITGRDGKVTGVEQRPGNGQDREERERER